MRVRAPLWARERKPSVLRSIVCKLLAVFRLSTVVHAFSRPRAPPRYPTPNLSPEPREIELVQISEASRKERPQVLIPSLGEGTLVPRWALPPPGGACIGPNDGPMRAISAVSACTGPVAGPVRAPWHAVENKNGRFCSLREAAARRREHFQGFFFFPRYSSSSAGTFSSFFVPSERLGRNGQDGLDVFLVFTGNGELDFADGNGILCAGGSESHIDQEGAVDA